MDIPLFDMGAWRAADVRDRGVLAGRLDRAMRDSGFFLVGGHGIDGALQERIRAQARAFFALPGAVKDRYATGVGGRGWIPCGREANAFYGEVADADRPDLKETFTLGRDEPGRDPAWFAANVWPAEVPGLREPVSAYAAQVQELYRELLEVLAIALGLDGGYFVERSRNAPYTFNINRYPPLTVTGTPLDGQFRVGPHTDWGILTILDRQPGYGGLQVQNLDGSWADAPYVPGAFTVNIADLLARWTGDRWRSTRHRVLPPPEADRDEELISLIVFCEADMDRVVTPLPPPAGGGANHPPVVAGDYFREREAAASVG
ncbi:MULTISPECIES: 2-oxoglutarate and iron-dependent oxygenase domain-containing protein [Actinoplanes]|uniref:isopenicillin N synthase family dioxygenase n=1 Tax=Actinoplanes TaxID=1865 RepID=UPI001FE1A227|nr:MULTISPECIES: 2-oxoglutarate and iron-dependent oxygenase domain-containing protein [Actinoplanes]GLY04272.1 oxidoreductase [Actinoplanes sp. NBRC 101535]